MSREIDRDKALRILQQPTYLSLVDMKKDIKYFLKKMDWSQEDLDKYISRPEVKHDNYKSEKQFWENLKKIYYSSSLIKSIIKK